MTREALAEYLHALADEFASGGEEIDVEVGNKTVTLTPPEEVDCDVEVVERSSMLRGRRERIDFDISWKQ